MCKHYYPWVLPLGYLKWDGEDFAACLSSPPATPSKASCRKKEKQEKERERDGDGADVGSAVDLQPDKGGTQAAGIDGLLVWTGLLCEMFSK